MTDKTSYAPPPNMDGNKGPGSYATQMGQPYPTTQAAFPPQPGFAPYGSPSSMPQDSYVSNGTDRSELVKGFEFSTESIRRGFIRKVYSILSVQLLLTVGAILLTIHRETGVGQLMEQNWWMFFVSLILVFVSLITLSCCEGVRRTSPHNVIFLALFTIGESICAAYSTLRYDPDVVLMAIGLTAVVVIALTVFAFQTKWDFTVLGGTLFVGLILFILVTFILSFWTSNNKTMELIICSFGVLIFSAYLIYDTQMIIGGDHKYSLSPEEYIFGAIALYLDILNLFLYILRILSASKN